MDHEAQRVINDDLIRQAILDLVTARGTAKSICPSEVARTIGGDAWRDAMPDIRRLAQRLINEDRIVATQRGVPVDPCTARGPIRLTLATHAGSNAASVPTTKHAPDVHDTI